MAIPFDEYPRPQLRRSSFLCLNGEWDFAVSDKKEPPKSFTEKILVPFPCESEASGICRRIGRNEYMIYRRSVIPPSDWDGKRVILHFGAVDQAAEVYWNGRLLGTNKGGFLPFSFEVTDDIREENDLTVIAADPLDRHEAWGKQKRKNGGMWYTPFSGIWQTVWMEAVPKEHITALKLLPALSSVRITVESTDSAPTTVIVKTPDGDITETFFGGITLPIPNPVLWTPETPHLYPFTLIHGEDRAESYFALRTVEAGEVNGVPRILLNGKPCFFHALLDQGYWPGGLCLPATPKGYETDILLAKSLGFNTLRKHIRIEPLSFYAACDRLGMLVMQDFVNHGHYSFLRDTALPTVGLKRLPNALLLRTKRTKERFLRTMEGTVRHLYNHPCIVYWTVFNEGWGQFDADGCYEKLRKNDKSRIIDTASGWFKNKKSDVESEHVYFRPYRFKKSRLPVVLSEFGGYGCSSGGKQYGYRFFADRKAYQNAVLRLYETEVLPAVSLGLCGAVYTQLSDVEEEQNGVFSFDRAECKLPKEEMKALAGRLQEGVASPD